MPLKTSSKTIHLPFGSQRDRESSEANDFHLIPVCPAAPHISALAAIWSLTRIHKKALEPRDELEDVYVACPGEPIIVDNAKKNKIRLLKINSVDANKNYGTLNVTNICRKHVRGRVSPYLYVRARCANASWFCIRNAQMIVVVSTICLNLTSIVNVDCDAI